MKAFARVIVSVFVVLGVIVAMTGVGLQGGGNCARASQFKAL